MSLAVYVYSDANRNQLTIDANDYNFTGTWSAFGTYQAATLDAADYGNSRYIAILDNVGVNPLYIPPRSQPKKWSPLVKIMDGDEPPFPPPVPSAGTTANDVAYINGTNALYAAWSGTYLASQAYALASTGTNVGTNAYNLATAAGQAASAAIDLANQALQTAWAGTNTGGPGDTTLAYTALQTAWSGTSGANSALAIAVAGTDAASAAQSQSTGAINIANQALVTGYAGTAAATAAATAANVAFSRANDAYYLASVGTNTSIDLANNIFVVNMTAGHADALAATGTAAASAAINLANQALQTAFVGTVTPEIALSDLTDVNVSAPTARQVLTWDGSKWVPTDGPAATAPFAFTYYIDQQSSGTNGYESLITAPSGAPEEATQHLVTAAGGPVFFGGFISDLLERTRLDAGLWEFNSFVAVDNGSRSAKLITDLYTRNLAGAESYLFSGTSQAFSTVAQPDPELLDVQVTQGSFATQLTDKLVLKYWAITPDPSVTVTFYHCGTAHDSHVHTPLRASHNDLAGLQGGQTDEYYHVTADQNAALVGTDGQPSVVNPYVTATDPHLATADAALQMAWTGTAAVQTERVQRLIAVAAEASARAFADGTEATNRMDADNSLQNQVSVQVAAGYVALQTAWSGTAGVNQVFPIAVAGTNLAQAAYDLASSGTSAAAASFLANQAYTIATAGTALAYTALQTAWTGTDAGAAGIALANAALTTAYAGTNAVTLANSALTTAYSGTSAIVVANKALTTAYAGTNAVTLANSALSTAYAGTNAITLANTALTNSYSGTTAVQLAGGTMTGNLRVPQIFLGAGTTATAGAGTIFYDMTGSPYQETTVDGTLTVSAKNITAGAEICAVLISSGTVKPVYYDSNFSWFGTLIPYTSATVGKKILVPLASTGTLASKVIGASTAQL